MTFPVLAFAAALSQNLVIAQTPVHTGASIMAQQGFIPLHDKKVGLVTNHTALVGETHLIDLLHAHPKVALTALFGPEHGLRGLADAGEKVTDDKDPATGVPVYSLYGENNRPTPEQLKNVDVLVFDIQDIGARFYTYISTLGLAMQSAAESNKTFVVLDRPNPLGGTQVSGWMLDPAFKSFVGQFPVPVQHGLTVGELALMIKGEAWLPGLENLDLQIVPCQNWTRDQLWPQTGLPFVNTSPNIPDFETALVYPGTCLFEALEASEGRGTRAPFLTLGSPHIDAPALLQDLQTRDLPGVRFQNNLFTPVSIPGMSAKPKLQDTPLQGIKITVQDPQKVRPVKLGVHLVHAFYRHTPADKREAFFNKRWMGLLSGSNRFVEQIEAGSSPQEIIDSWQPDQKAFLQQRTPYLLYK